MIGLFVLSVAPTVVGGELVETPYEQEQKVVFDFFLDDPGKMGSALFWIRSLTNPLAEEPYGYSIDFMDIKVVIHGTEIVTLVEKNYDRYREVVERMKYYAEFGVEFKVCGLAAHDYGYVREDFLDFVQIVPSAITELAHWQQKGYALITPVVLEKRFAIEEIR
ncbi:MAG: DsrE family protein [Chromatiales bacterium]